MMNDRRKINPFKVSTTIIEVILVILSIIYLLYTIIFIRENQLFNIINCSLLFITCILIVFENLTSKPKNTYIYKMAFSITFSLLFILNILNSFNVINLNNDILLKDFTNTKISDALVWANENKVQIEQVYEYSDNVKEYEVISQNILPKTPLNDVEILKLVISLGPNYDKKVIVSDLTGQSIDTLLEEKNKLFLNNVEINYQINEEIPKDTITYQSFKGEMTRNNKISFTISLGSTSTLSPIAMIDLKEKSLFDAILWLKRNGLKYKLTYDFHDTIIKDYVISQDILTDTTVTPNKDVVTLIVSKGKKIIVPNLLNMTSEEVVDWVIDNNLKIEFSDKYDESKPLGEIISANYKEFDEIESGTTIKIVTSKGQLKMREFTSLSEFRSWANSYNINYDEEYQTSNTIKKGNIISFSYKKDEIINPSSTIIVKVSSGKAITVPNFYNKSKTNITETCNNLGLECSFYDSAYSSITDGYAISQNMKANSVVNEGTHVSIGLSKGIAKTFTIEINAAKIQECAGSSDCTINYLKGVFNTKYSGVSFTYLKKASNIYNFAGNIHESSPIKDGSKVTQGKSYTVWITN